MCVGVMGTALASPLYPLYQAQWQLQPSHITGIYVAYMGGALASLLFLGRFSRVRRSPRFSKATVGVLPTTAMELTPVDFFLQTLVVQCQANCRLGLHMDGSRGLCQLALD